MYNKNEIKQMIFRLDFVEKTASQSILDNPMFLEKILDFFKNQQPDEVQTITELKQEPQVPDTFKATPRKKIIKNFSTVDGSVNLKYNENMLVFSALSYSTKEEFSKLSLPILEALLSLEEHCVVSRIGLRFINVFPSKEYSNTDFNKKYKTFLSNFQENDEDILFSQSIIHEELICDDIRAKLNFGYYNPTMPSTLKSKDILIDIDIIHGGAVKTKEDIYSIFQRSQSIAEKIFEGIISDNLRKKLGEAND